MGRGEEPRSREQLPDDRAIEKEERKRSAQEIEFLKDQLKRVLRAMRKEEPYLFVVFKEWCKARELRDEQNPQYKHGVYRGFYAEQSKRLGIRPNTVQHRLEKAHIWAARWLERHE